MSAPGGAAAPFAARHHSPARRQLRARRRLRADLAQLLSALIGFALGLVLPLVDGGPTEESSRFSASLVTWGIGVVGIVSIVYSLLFGWCNGRQAASLLG